MIIASYAYNDYKITVKHKNAVYILTAHCKDTLMLARSYNTQRYALTCAKNYWHYIKKNPNFRVRTLNQKKSTKLYCKTTQILKTVQKLDRSYDARQIAVMSLTTIADVNSFMVRRPYPRTSIFTSGKPKYLYHFDKQF